MKKNPLSALLPLYFDRLYSHFGKQYWWPCKSGQNFEIITGAILTQNTAWTNVEKALSNLASSGIVTAEKILLCPEEDLQKYIAPAGFFRQKSIYLKIMADFYLTRDAFYKKSSDMNSLRKELLSLKGVGRETADSILLYAYNKPIFVIDAYTRRFASRHLGLDEKMPYDDMQKIFMDNLQERTEIFNEYHALIVQLCKESCMKKGCGTLCGKLFQE